MLLEFGVIHNTGVNIVFIGFWCFVIFDEGARKKRKKKFEFIVLKHVIPYKAGCGTERWMGSAGLAVECGLMMMTTSTLMAIHLTPSLCEKID